MQSLIQASNDAGWLANLLGILTFIGACAGLFYRFVRPRLKPASLDKIIPPDFAVKWSPVRAKSWARIAIVDDQPNDFPIADLRSDGYQIQVYKQANLTTTGQLANYDIVFLDMKGIVKDDPEMGGLKLIAELRRVNPRQKICAVSSKTFDPTATDFFRQANDYRKKPLTAHECRAVIDTFLMELFPADRLRTEGRRPIDRLNRNVRIAAVAEVSKFIRAESTEAKLLDRLQQLGLSLSEAHDTMNLARAVADETA